MTTTRTASHTDLDDAVPLAPTHPAELEIITVPSSQPSPTRPPLLTQRTALLLLVAVLLGGLVGALTFAATPVLATAVIAGLFTTGTVLLGGHQLLE